LFFLDVYRPSQKIGLLYARQETDRPTPGLKSKGWADKKIAPNLYKIAGAKFGGKFIGGMIAPDPQQEAGSAVSQENLKIWFLLFSLFRSHPIDLGMQ
jgi:hypothetical protein